MNEKRIQLADWIAAIRLELTEAAIMQKEREEIAVQQGRDLAVPPMKVKEIQIELEVSTDIESSNVVQGKAGLGIRFWVVSSAELSAERGQARKAGATQKLTLTLEPEKPLRLGSEAETSLLE